MNCPKCHAPIQQNEVFCGQCGTKVTPTQTTVLRTATTSVDLLAATIPAFDKSKVSQSNKRFLVISVLCLLLISVFVCGLLTKFGGTTSSMNTTHQSSIPTVGFTLPNSTPTVLPMTIPTLAPTSTPTQQPTTTISLGTWQGVLTGCGAITSCMVRLSIEHVNGNNFSGTWSSGDYVGSDNFVNVAQIDNGTIQDGEINWQTSRLISGDLIVPCQYTGNILGDKSINGSVLRCYSHPDINPQGTFHIFPQ